MPTETTDICDGCGNLIVSGAHKLPIKNQRFHDMECALRHFQAKRIKTDSDEKLIRELLKLRSYSG